MDPSLPANYPDRIEVEVYASVRELSLCHEDEYQWDCSCIWKLSTGDSLGSNYAADQAEVETEIFQKKLIKMLEFDGLTSL